MSMYFPNRTLCDVLAEMRKCHETRNFAPLLGLIEEAQTFGNRMEAGLGDKRDLLQINEELSELRGKRKELKRKVEALERKLGEKK